MCVAGDLSFNLRETVNTIRKTSEDLKKQMSEADKLVCDLQHEIEFNKFDVCKGYKKLKQLQDALQQRRIIKNEFELLQPLITYTKGIEGKINKLYDTIIYREVGVKNRKYRPRVLKNDNEESA